MPKVYILTAFYDKIKEFDTDQEAYEWIWNYASRTFETTQKQMVATSEEELRKQLQEVFPTYTVQQPSMTQWTYRMI